MQAACGVLLDHELMALAARLARASLRRDVEGPFLAVDLKTHVSARALELAPRRPSRRAPLAGALGAPTASGRGRPATLPTVHAAPQRVHQIDHVRRLRLRWRRRLL